MPPVPNAGSRGLARTITSRQQLIADAKPLVAENQGSRLRQEVMGEAERERGEGVHECSRFGLMALWDASRICPHPAPAQNRPPL